MIFGYVSDNTKAYHVTIKGAYKKMKMKLFLILSCFIASVWCRPAKDQTNGAPWPLPQVYSPSDVAIKVSKQFSFLAAGKDCDILEAAVARYSKLLFGEMARSDKLIFESSSVLKSVSVNLIDDCEMYPHINMDESCEFLLFAHTFDFHATTVLIF